MEAWSDSKSDPDGAGLRLFLDSAAPADWARFLPLGVFYGVTTNPMLLQRAGQKCTLNNLAAMVTTMAEFGVREIQVQVWGESVAEMVSCGQHLGELKSSEARLVIKVPATEMGLQAAAQLSGQGHAITLTAVYTPGQVLLAAGMDAAYAAPYLNRLVEAGQPGPEIVLAMSRILVGTSSPTRLLVASLRSAEQILDLAAQGLDTFTFGSAVADELLSSELTAKAARQFQAAAEAMGSNKESR